MPHPKQIDADGVLASALELLEASETPEISIRAVAARLGVKAPSLYRYFADKAALEQAILAAIHRMLRAWLVELVGERAGEDGLLALALGYLEFARKRPQLYAFLTGRRLEPGMSEDAKELWGFMLVRIGQISGDADDTDHGVALWAFLHGFASLEHAGRFGKSGPKGGSECGLEALLESMRGARRRRESLGAGTL